MKGLVYVDMRARILPPYPLETQTPYVYHGSPRVPCRVCQDIVDLGVLDGEIDLGTATSIQCPANEDKEDLSEILVKSGTTLTLKSTQSPFR